MLVAIYKGDPYPAYEIGPYAREDAEFRCPECNGKVIFKQGPKVTAHFAHKPPSVCSYGAGETELHRRTKMSVFNACKVWATSIALEAPFAGGRPDVLLDAPAIGTVAIEVQDASIDDDSLFTRTNRIVVGGASVLWLVPVTRKVADAVSDGRLSPPRWQKWLHALYFGRVHFVDPDATVVPIHFGPFQIGDWYDHPELGTVGGPRPSKRFRAPILGDHCNISDMRVMSADAGEVGPFRLPRRSLLTSAQAKWW